MILRRPPLNSVGRDCHRSDDLRRGIPTSLLAVGLITLQLITGIGVSLAFAADPPSPTPSPPPFGEAVAALPVEQGGCFRTGCSGHVCAAQHVITTCEWLPEYACWRLARCAPVADPSDTGQRRCAFQIEPGDPADQCLRALGECVFDDCPDTAATATATATPTPSPPPTAGAQQFVACPGDCDGDGRVRVHELVRGVGIDLQAIELSLCAGLDTNSNEAVTVDELVAATNAALYGCLPDLVVTSARNLPCPGGCAPARVEICVANQGHRDAGRFGISLNGICAAELDALAAGADTCLTRTYRFAGSGEHALVRIDSADTVQEDDESNSELSFPRPNPTACDRICGD